MGRGIGRVPHITLCLSLVAGCTGGDAESETSTTTASEASSSSGSSSAGGSTGTPGADTTGGASTPTGTEGQDTGDTEDTEPTVTAGETGAPVGPSFAAEVWPIFDAACSCHKDSGGAGMLHLSSDDAYPNLVDMPSTQATMMKIVEPGSAEDSYLWHKLNDTQLEVGGYGQRMPSGGLLEPAALELIRQWIDAGAHP